MCGVPPNRKCCSCSHSLPCRATRRGAGAVNASHSSPGHLARRRRVTRPCPAPLVVCPVATARAHARARGRARRRAGPNRARRAPAAHPHPGGHRLHRPPPGALRPGTRPQAHAVQPRTPSAGLAGRGRGTGGRSQHRRPVGPQGPRVGCVHRQPDDAAVLGARRGPGAQGQGQAVHLHLDDLGVRRREGRRRRRDGGRGQVHRCGPDEGNARDDARQHGHALRAVEGALRAGVRDVVPRHDDRHSSWAHRGTR